MKIANDLRHGLFNAEKLIGEEIIDLNGFVFIQSLDMCVGGVVDVANAGFYNNVVEACMRQLGEGRLFLDLIQVSEQVASPGSRLVKISVFLDDLFKLLIMVHSSSPLFGN